MLVVDDHTATRSGIKSILDAEIGITVVGEATNVESAVSMAARRKPDVVVMDLQLDGDDGGGFAATRRVLDADPKVGVMMFTAFGEHHLLTDGLGGGRPRLHGQGRHPRRDGAGCADCGRGRAYLDPSLSADLLRGRGIGQIPGLSGREREILAMLADGESNREIAAKLYLSTETVRTHVRNAMRKLDADTRTQAVALAIRQRLIG